MSSLLELLPTELFRNIALHSLRSPLLGPPAFLTTLLTLSSNLYHKLTDDHTFLSAVFHLKFDFAAPKRRFRHLLNRAGGHIRAELISRCLLLKRLKYAPDASSPTLERDFWKAVLMLLESDGKNEYQLFYYANLPHFLYTWHHHTFAPQGVAGSLHYPEESVLNSLGLYLLWRVHTLPQDAQQAERNFQVACSLNAYNAASFKYANGYAPDVHYHLSITSHLRSAAESRPPHEQYPVYRPAVNYKKILSSPGTTTPELVSHFGMTLPLVPPLLVHSTILFFSTCHELPGWPILSSAPATRAERDRIGERRASREDIDDHNLHGKTRYIPQLHPESFQGSERFDQDFSRTLLCGDPFEMPSWAMDKVYKIGSLSGEWGGRQLFPIMPAHEALVANPQLPAPPETIFMTSNPLYVTLNEWYCPTCHDPMVWDHNDPAEGLKRAWLPRDAVFEESRDGDYLNIESNGKTYTYYRWRADEALLHTEYCAYDCDMSDNEPEDQDLYLDPAALYRADRCPQYLDIIVTGRSSHENMMAWNGDYKFLGRVRPYDGMVVFTREWAREEPNGDGRWIFRGYLTADQNFVGRWRDGATDATTPGVLEGSFTLNKRPTGH